MKPRRDTPVLRKTEDHRAIRSLALSAGLEDGNFDDVVVSIGCYVGHDLIGCAALKVQRERFSIEWLAVSEGMRGRGLGSMLVAGVEEEAKRRGARRLWALARAPEFFEKNGYRKPDESDADGLTLTGCMSCRQYCVSCYPAVFVKNL